jgi:hypothetical protein
MINTAIISLEEYTSLKESEARLNQLMNEGELFFVAYSGMTPGLFIITKDEAVKALLSIIKQKG